MNRVLFVDHVDRILGGAQVNLLELLPELLAEPSLRVACACAPAGPLSQRLRELGVEQFPHQLPAAAGALRVVGRGFSFSTHSAPTPRCAKPNVNWKKPSPPSSRPP